MKLGVAWIGRTKSAAIETLTSDYLQRLARYLPTDSSELASEVALQRHLDKVSSKPFIVLLESGGKQLSSEELAKFIDQHQGRGTQSIMFAVGPASGFTERTRQAANFQLSLGRMTLPHELARVVLLEQLYRAFTILKKHPYHLGH